MNYDPDTAPDPNEWLGIDEGERIATVETFHKGVFEDHRRTMAHSTFHVIVENQIAVGEKTPARATAERLMSEGISRHEAIHAIGSVLSGVMADAVKGQALYSEESYFKELEELTVEKWVKDYSGED